MLCPCNVVRSSGLLCHSEELFVWKDYGKAWIAGVVCPIHQEWMMDHIVHSIYKPSVKEGYTQQVMYTVSRNSCQMHLIGGKGMNYSLLSLHFPSQPKPPVPAYIILGIVCVCVWVGGGEPDCGSNGGHLVQPDCGSNGGHIRHLCSPRGWCTICTLIFVGFIVPGFCRLAAIC